jgi:hypothetical protein
MSATDGSNSLGDLDHAALLELRKELRRPLYTLVVTQQDANLRCGPAEMFPPSRQDLTDLIMGGSNG